MTQIVWIAGPAADLGGLLGIDGLDIAIHSGRQLPGGVYRIAAYATDAALDTLQTQHPTLTVEVVVNAATLDDQTQTLFGQIERAPGETIDPEVM